MEESHTLETHDLLRGIEKLADQLFTTFDYKAKKMDEYIKIKPMMLMLFLNIEKFYEALEGEIWKIILEDSKKHDQCPLEYVSQAEENKHLTCMMSKMVNYYLIKKASLNEEI